MSQIIATRVVNGGRTTLVQQICTSCRHAFWQVGGGKAECVDCDPAYVPPEDGNTVGRDYHRPISESQYHGAGYRD